MSWLGFSFGLCIAALCICGLSTTCVYWEMITQIQEKDRAFHVSYWGRPSTSEHAKVLRAHRLYYPASHLRKAYWLLYAVLFVTVLMLIALAFTHPSPPGR